MRCRRGWRPRRPTGRRSLPAPPAPRRETPPVPRLWCRRGRGERDGAMPDVTCMGIVVADIIVRPVDAWPQRGRLALEESIVLRSGGLAHTTGIVLAKLGVDTAVVARVGADLFGDFLVQILADHGVQPHVVREPQAPTSTTVVAVSSGGERSFMHLIGANGGVAPPGISHQLLPATKIFHPGGCLLLPAPSGEPAAGLLRRAREQGCR